MGISVVGAQAESGSNDFTLNIGTSGNTTFALDKTYPSGRYEVDFINNDSTYDIYAVTAAGSYVGYTNSTSIDITQDFRTIVVLGAANNEKITFTFSGPIATAGTKGDVVGAAAFLTEVVTAALPDIDDTTVVNGGNFATDVEISFIGQDTNETNAKSVVRSSSTQLVVTRPDSFSPAQSPYTLKALNPGIPAPTGSNSHLLSNAVTAGTSPAWVTGTTIYYNVGGATSITLVAEDTEASDVDYSITSGTLPTGLSLDSETGVISGTFSGSASEGDVTSITVRATDAGGNYVDRTFSLTANTAPTWATAAGAIDPAQPETAYSFQLVASTGSAGGTLAYSLQTGTLPAGLSLSSSGLISGTSTETVGTTRTFTIRVSDEAGLFVDREFSIVTEQTQIYALIAEANLTSPGSGNLVISNIPQDYTHLEIYYSYRRTSTSNTSLFLFLNPGDGTNVASLRTTVAETGTETAQSNFSGATSMFIGDIGGTQRVSGTLLIPDYSNSNKRAQVLSRSSIISQEYRTTIAVGGRLGSSAINSIAFTGDPDTNILVSVYGIKES